MLKEKQFSEQTMHVDLLSSLLHTVILFDLIISLFLFFTQRTSAICQVLLEGASSIMTLEAFLVPLEWMVPESGVGESLALSVEWIVINMAPTTYWTNYRYSKFHLLGNCNLQDHGIMVKYVKCACAYLRQRKMIMRTRTRVTARLAATIPPAMAPSLVGSVIVRSLTTATPA